MTIPPSCASSTAAVFYPARTSRCWRRANTSVRSRSASRASDSVFPSGWPGPCSSSGVSALPDTAPRNVIEKPPVKAVKADKVHAAVAALPGEERVLRAAEKALNGQTRGLRALLPFLGPAFVASVAYVDPGNFATNMAGGAQFGYMLLWVVLAANLMAMVIQSMSAKLGIATGRSLPEVCRDRFPRPVVIFLWIQAELIAMATDLAEFVGAALGIYLVFGLPLFISGLLTGVLAFGILALQAWGFRRLEATISMLVGVIVIAFGLEVLRSDPSWGAVA